MEFAVGQHVEASAIAVAVAFAKALATEVAWAWPLAQAVPPWVVVVWTVTLATAVAMACAAQHTKRVYELPSTVRLLKYCRASWHQSHATCWQHCTCCPQPGPLPLTAQPPLPLRVSWHPTFKNSPAGRSY